MATTSTAQNISTATPNTGTQTTPICPVCGKNTPKSNGIGHRCSLAQNVAAAAAAWVQAHTVNAVPTGYIKLATFKQIIPANKSKVPGLSINKLVAAIGGDNGYKIVNGIAVVGQPAHIIATPVYVNRVRYVHAWLGTHAGLVAIATNNWAKAPSAK